jgi:hypothetical protein
MSKEMVTVLTVTRRPQHVPRFIESVAAQEFDGIVLRRCIYVCRRREQNEIQLCLVGGCQRVAQAADVHVHGQLRLGFAEWNDVHRRQMHDCRGPRLPGHLDDIGRICNVRTDEPKEITTQVAGDAIEAMLISIDGDDDVAFPDQGINEHRTDESSGAGDENSGS